MPQCVLDPIRAAMHHAMSDMILHAVEEMAEDKSGTTRRAVMDF
jgi:hypothetical protein